MLSYTEPFKAQWLLHIPPDFNTQKFYVLPTHSIYVFCVDVRKKQQLFPFAALTGFYNRGCVFTAR